MKSREAGIGAVVVALVVAAIVVLGGVAYLSLASPRPTGTTVTSIQLDSTTQNDFTVQGPVPLITVTPQNDTFTLNYNATTLAEPATAIGFILNQSTVTIYANGTQWVSSSQACSTQPPASSTEGTSQNGSTTVLIITVSANPCGVPPAPNWYAVNGSIIVQRALLNSSQVEMSVAPSSMAANTTTSLTFTVTVNMKPGVYVLWLVLGVQTGSYFEYSQLNAFPIIVKQ